MKRYLNQRHGQAILMVTLALFVMCGILGLAVDLGWSFYVKKSAQAAADSAALVAAQQAFQIVGAPLGPLASCPSGVTCQAATACPGTNNLQNGCMYAQQNGFTPATSGQNMTMAADITLHPPTVPNVSVYYWVTARAYQSIPQLFSSVLGNNTGAASARATAALLNLSYPGTIYALNRQNDPSPCGTGVGICGGGNAHIEAAPGSIFIASNIAGAGDVHHGDGAVTGNTYVRTPGTTNWPSTTTQLPQSPNFNDPMAGKGQPPAPTSAGGNGLAPLPASGIYVQPIPTGVFPGSAVPCTAGYTCLTPGYYYASKSLLDPSPTGAPIQFNSNVEFLPNDPVHGTTSTFGQYVFFGGVSINGTAKFDSGEYIFAGVCPSCAAGTDTSLDLHATLQQGSGTAGEIFVFTDGKYSINNSSQPLQAPANLLGTVVYNSLVNAPTTINMKNGTTGDIQGLSATNAPSGLQTFAPVIMWTDQQSSPIKYTSKGFVDTTSCGAGHTLDNPCPNPNGLNPGPAIAIDPGNASMSVVNGTIYQPRGSSLQIIHGTGSLSGAVQIITGSIDILSGNGHIDPSPLPTPPSGVVVALIE